MDSSLSPPEGPEDLQVESAIAAAVAALQEHPGAGEIELEFRRVNDMQNQGVSVDRTVTVVVRREPRQITYLAPPSTELVEGGAEDESRCCRHG